jgi:hypothetical protein
MRIGHPVQCDDEALRVVDGDEILQTGEVKPGEIRYDALVGAVGAHRIELITLDEDDLHIGRSCSLLDLSERRVWLAALRDADPRQTRARA